jgi:hypothetical protein
MIPRLLDILLSDLQVLHVFLMHYDTVITPCDTSSGCQRAQRISRSQDFAFLRGGARRGRRVKSRSSPSRAGTIRRRPGYRLSTPALTHELQKYPAVHATGDTEIPNAALATREFFDIYQRAVQSNRKRLRKREWR